MRWLLKWMVPPTAYRLGYFLFGMRFAHLIGLRIVILRHGEAEHDVLHRSEWSIKTLCSGRLTPRGTLQAQRVGKQLSDFLSDRLPICCYHSPFPRCQMTLLEVLKGALCDPAELRVFEAPEVREWNAGCEHNSEPGDPVLEDIYRERLLGESIDACRCRASQFLGRLVRDLPRYAPTKILIVTHSIWSLCFIARFFHLTDDEFLTLEHLGNCEYVEIAPSRLLPNYEFEWRGWGVRGIGRRA